MTVAMTTALMPSTSDENIVCKTWPANFTTMASGNFPLNMTFFAGNTSVGADNVTICGDEMTEGDDSDADFEDNIVVFWSYNQRILYACLYILLALIGK